MIHNKIKQQGNLKEVSRVSEVVGGDSLKIKSDFLTAIVHRCQSLPRSV